jgi:myo-inositol 2-dehydrogenase/D-chiro-inositol 1-dehydrogenase
VKNKTLQVGVIGAGRIGKIHARSLAFRIPEAQVAAIADVDAGAAREAAEALRVPKALSDYREILADRQIQAVVICAPTPMHSALIQEAAAAGKHIFCEKPVDFDLARIDAALAAVKKAGVKLQIGFNRRFDANFARVRKAVAEGEIGQPQLLHIVSRDPGPPPLSYVKSSGGIFMDMTIHDFDMARFLIGAEVEEVYTQAAVTVDPAIGQAGDLDTAVVLLKFANGVIGTIDNCRQAVYGYDQRVEVLGKKGAAASQNNYPNSVVFSGGEAIRRDLPLNFFLERYAESFVTEMRLFVEAVLQDKPTPVGGLDGRHPVVMARAARKSYDEHRPVRLAEVDR